MFAVRLRLALLSVGIAAILGIGLAIPVTAAGETVMTFDAPAGQFPEGIVVGSDGTIYAGLVGSGQLVRFSVGDEAFEVVSQIDGLVEGDFGLLGLTIGQDGFVVAGVFSASLDVNGVWRFDPESGDAARIEGTEEIGMANDVVFDDSGNLYVSDTMSGAIWKVDTDGAVGVWLDDDLVSGDGSVGFPFSLGANGLDTGSSSDTLYVGVTELGTVVAVPVAEDGSAGTPAIFAAFTNESGPELIDGVAVDEDGNVYATFLSTHQVVKIEQDGSHSIVGTVDDGLDGPASVAVGRGPEGSLALYVTNLSFAMDPVVPPGGAGPAVVMLTVEG